MTQSLNTMLLADLKSLASGLGIKGSSSMKKAQLVEAIKAAGAQAQSGAGKSGADKSGQGQAEQSERPQVTVRTRQRSRQGGQGDQGGQGGTSHDGEANPDAGDSGTGAPEAGVQGQKKQRQPRQKQGDQAQKDQAQKDQSQKQQQDQKQGDQKQGDQKQQQDQSQKDAQPDVDDTGAEEGSSRRSRRRRGRERERTRQGGAAPRFDSEPQVLDDDVLVPAAGILDVLDNYAFVRTGGYLPSVDDVYLSLSMVRKYGLRRGDALVGQVRQPREGERKEKFNPMVRIDSVNGADPEAARTRVEFDKLTPLSPQERLRLETTPDALIGRMIDLFSPLGKGQRGMLVAPPNTGRTTALQAISSAVTTNNPECHLMVVLVDERPEEVTEFQRSVKGEVIASTFDRPPADHTTVAELALERAKRLVELGHDVVILLDGLTRLARAYNLTIPASGRILGAGVDAAAIHPPKRFFGAARNVEMGGSLTILATVVVESSSRTDEVIFEELTGTANLELRLGRDLAEAGSWPAVDVVRSVTRRDELLLDPDEARTLTDVRRALGALGEEAAHAWLVDRLRSSGSNAEFLLAAQESGPRS